MSEHAKIVSIGAARDPAPEPGKFKAGDCVQLASGGMRMTIRSIDAKGKLVLCDWFNADGLHERDDFQIAQLRHAVEETGNESDGEGDA